MKKVLCIHMYRIETPEKQTNPKHKPRQQSMYKSTAGEKTKLEENSGVEWIRDKGKEGKSC